MDVFRGSSVSVDVSLFAVLLALSFTGKNRTLKMVVLLVLMGHVLMTTNGSPLSTLGAQGGDGDVPQDDASDDESPETDPEVSDPQNEPTNTVEASDVPRVQKTVSNSEFDRQFSIPPEYSRTDGILPRTSEAANSKLARSRTMFFDNILPS